MYDYVVVGAGSAGCVLANRLSAREGARVLLLEAGGADTRREIRVPAMFSRLFKTEVDWAFETEPQEWMDGRRLYWPRGKVLGGSSSLNAMIYIRGNRRDFEGWARAAGDRWAAERVWQAYERSLGELSVEARADVNPVSRAMVEAAVEAGWARREDFNGGEQEGFGFYRVTQKRGERHSAADAFLRPAMGRKGLEVKTGAMVSRIVIERGRARGVRYVADGREEEAGVSGEVIVAAGAVQTPQLLMVSGVGAAGALERLGIRVVCDSPEVGANLQDHPAAPVIWRCRRAVTLGKAGSAVEVAKYMAFRRGMLGSNVAECGGFVRTRGGLERPDVQFHFAPGFFLEHGFRQEPGHWFTMGPTVVRPRSRGWIRLKTARMEDAPAIEPHYFEEEEDRRAMVEGIRVARRIAAGRALEEFRGEEYLPGATVEGDGELMAHVRKYGETLYHPAGTCRMGSDGSAVVDGELKVRGVEGLRVADASVMPEVVTGNTNAAAMMIGEMAAEAILGG